MKEWILENTKVTKQQYDSIINLDTVTIKGQANKKNFDIDFNNPITHITKFTLYPPLYSRRVKYKIKKIKDTNKRHCYIYKNIKFYIIGEVLSRFQEETYSPTRLNRCFYLNSEICLAIKSNCSLITAMCEFPFDKNHSKYLHTFVIITDQNNDEYILDGTLNAIIEKKTYYEIFKPEIISCIPNEKLKEDLKLLKTFETDETIYRTEYLCFPNEVMSTVKKLTRKPN